MTFDQELDAHHLAGVAHHHLAVLAVHPDWQGHGIATEAARALVGWLRGHEVTALMATIHPGNTASAMVARRIGLVPTDDLVDDETVWVSST